VRGVVARGARQLLRVRCNLRPMSDEHRTRGRIPWSWVVRELTALGEIWVATSGAAGPDAVPVWFWFDDPTVYFTTKAVARKARNIERDPRVIVHNGNGIDTIILKGDAVTVTDRAELERVDAAYYEKYVAPDTGEHATIFIEGDVCYRVRPRLVMAWQYATVANRTDWRFR
jgi:nitroimidazol reductase NimA-like FMN-containing flavoprotein (pyridoxamine 5'-phosphate oxidase superfamily)